MSLDKQNLYRFPWSMTDNPVGWVEITDVCNIHCKGCYRQNLEGHKTLDAIKEEILLLKKWRNCSIISIAGGEPSLHPDIIEIVRFTANNKMNPLLISNGAAITKELLNELKKAGLARIIFHVDMWQNRPGWEGKNEKDLCELRTQLADMLYEAGRIPCGFNITVYKENLPFVPDLVQWSIDNADKVWACAFICYRAMLLQPNKEYLVNDKKIKLEESSLGHATEENSPEDIAISTIDVYKKIKKYFPKYKPCGYLGGTKLKDSFKWTTGVALCRNGEIFGSFGKKSMEFIQTMCHLLSGRYIGFTNSKSLGRRVFLLALIDPDMRQALGRYLRNTLNLLHPPQTLDITILQAPDILPHGEVDMCDGCPDMTLYNGKLVNSCRLDEYRKFGCLVIIQPKE